MIAVSESMGACFFAQGQWSSEDNRRGMTCDVAWIRVEKSICLKKDGEPKKHSCSLEDISRVENAKLGESSFFFGGSFHE